MAKVQTPKQAPRSLRDVREALGYSQEDVAEGSLLSVPTIRKVEAGESVNITTLERLAAFYDLTLEDVLASYVASRGAA